MKIFRNILYVSVDRLMDRFFFIANNLFVRTEIRRIKRSLGKCGTDVHIQWPVVITHPNKVYFGSRVSLAAYVHIWGGGGVYIGNEVMIGTHTSISSLTHNYEQERMFFTLIRRPVIIEDNVWIGSNCVILPGVRIGTGAVIGAGAVVTKDVPPDTIVVGVPARPLKRRKYSVGIEKMDFASG